MSYVVNKTNGNIVAVVEDGTIDSTSTSLTLFGKGVQNYGEYVAENLVKIAENFANTVEPPHPMEGQLWYSTSDKILRVYDGKTWTAPVAAAFYSTVTDSVGTATIDIQNDAGITVGKNAQIQLSYNTGFGRLELTAKSNHGPKTVFSIDPSTGLATVSGNPTVSNGVATKQYVDNINKISMGTNTATIDSVGFSVSIAGEDRILASSNRIVLTGNVYAPTVVSNANGDEVATTAYVQKQKIDTVLQGVPTATTAFSSDNSNRIATTAFVQNNKVSPNFTGIPTAPTAPLHTATTQIATTEFVRKLIDSVDLSPYAPRVSPAFVGIPTAPTPLLSDSSAQVATTEFVHNLVSSVDLTPYAPKNNPVFTGVPQAPTPKIENSSLQVANTSFVQELIVNRLQPYAPKVSPVFTGIPIAPTPGIAAPKDQITTVDYVDSRLRVEMQTVLSNSTEYIITSGTQTVYAYTNIVGSWSDGANFFDIFPPASKSMSDLVAFIPSIATIYYAGGANSDDSMRCVWRNMGNRIRVYVQNSEQRAAPSANWLAIWRK